MEQNPIQNDLRKKRRNKRVPPRTVCVLCGESAPETLEEHHPLGVANNRQIKVWICKNCHAKQTELQRTHGVDLSHNDRHPWETIESIILAVGMFLVELGKMFLELAEMLAASIRSMDAKLPQWREVAI